MQIPLSIFFCDVSSLAPKRYNSQHDTGFVLLTKAVRTCGGCWVPQFLSSQYMKWSHFFYSEQKGSHRMSSCGVTLSSCDVLWFPPFAKLGVSMASAWYSQPVGREFGPPCYRRTFSTVKSWLLNSTGTYRENKTDPWDKCSVWWFRILFFTKWND